MKNLSKILFGIVVSLIKPLLALIVGFLILQACSCKTNTNTTITKASEKTERTDSSSSVRERIVIKDSIVYQPKVEIRYQVINPCDSNGKLKPINQSTKIGKGKSSLKSSGDTLFVDCDCEEQINSYKSKLSESITINKSLQRIATNILNEYKKTIDETYTPFWNWVLITFLVILSGSLIIILIKK